MLQPYIATINALPGTGFLVAILAGMLSSAAAAPPLVLSARLQPAMAAIRILMSSNDDEIASFV